MYVIKQKSEVFTRFLEWKSMVGRSTGRKLKTLRTDNGGEYTSRDFQSYLKTEGIRHELTVPKNPEQNGVAERMNRTLLESVRAMLADVKLPQKFWAEALSTAVYLRNRSPTTAINYSTPYEALTGAKPDVKHLRVFGCTAYAHTPKDERRKLESKARKSILMGYGTETKGHRLYDHKQEKVFYSRDVRFNELECGVEKESSEPDERQYAELEFPSDDEPLSDIPVEPIPRRCGRERRPPAYYGELANSVNLKEPHTFNQALDSPDKQHWTNAMENEMDSLYKNYVWDLVELPKDRKAVGSKWVFKIKNAADGSIERYKARLVAQGFSQKYGQDYDETFCPVVRSESIRTLISLSVRNGLKHHQMDVTTAFLNGELDEEVYMKQPKGFAVKGQENLVCKLKKAFMD